MRFDEAPRLVIWEATQACDSTCGHCRPSAVPQRHSPELSTEEACRLLKTVRQFGKCGYCEYRRLCGGSRARAYPLTADYLAQDPRCLYRPSMEIEPRAESAAACVGT